MQNVVKGINRKESQDINLQIDNYDLHCDK